MLLRNKNDLCIYDVSSEYSLGNISIYACLKERSVIHPKAKYAKNFAIDYDSLAEFLDDWEDAE